jgi:hypothetical protein
MEMDHAMNRAIVPTLLAAAAVAVTATATAETRKLKEQLTKDEIAAATKAARDRLPPVDPHAVKKCSAMPATTAAERHDLALCYRAAGSLGASIAVWKVVIQDRDTKGPRKAAMVQLAAALEAAGSYADAATIHSEYAKIYGAEADAADHMIRAICIWRQLGVADEAERGFAFLAKLMKKKTPDGEKLCDSVRPIVPPAK